MHRRWTRAAAIVLVALTACPGRGAPPAATQRSHQPPAVRGGSLRVLLGHDVDALDPQRAGNPSSYGIMRALHRGLMAFPARPGADGAGPVPDLAAAPPGISADGLRYTFHLRDGVAFGPPALRLVV
ncbi:MAG: ABC transporter substrate-binding protein, partial [Actinobacteria bacterium]